MHREEGEVNGDTQTDISCGQLLELERERMRGIKIKRWTDMRKSRRIIKHNVNQRFRLRLELKIARW